MKLQVWTCAAMLAFAIGCARPVVDTGARPVGVGGTIAGSVRATGDTAPLSGRKITAINQATNARFETSTGASGTYTLKVPAGTYQLELELRAGETFETRPDATDVGVGDIDSARDFVVTVRR
jgi:hypothetical protein